MKKFISGVLLGALVPGIIAYTTHQRANDLKKELTAEVLSIETAVDSTDGMDRSFQKYQSAVRLWEIGGEYSLVQHSMQQYAAEYDGHAEQLSLTLQGRTTALRATLGNDYQKKAEDLIERINQRVERYAAHAVQTATQKAAQKAR